MTANCRTANKSEPDAEQKRPRVRTRALRLGLPARLATIVVVAAVVALFATGCGHHLHITVHAGQQASIHVTKGLAGQDQGA